MQRKVPMSPLSRFFVAYISEDDVIDSPDIWMSVERFIQQASIGERRLVGEELHEILKRVVPEDELEATVSRLGLAYYPPGLGLTYRDWLSDLEQRVLSGVP